MIKNAVQHNKKVDLSIAAVQLNTIIRYIFSEQYRILNRSIYKKVKFHLGHSIFKKNRVKKFLLMLLLLTFIKLFLSVHCKTKSYIKKKEKLHHECTNQDEKMQRSHVQRNNKAHNFKTYLD